MLYVMFLFIIITLSTHSYKIIAREMSEMTDNKKAAKTCFKKAGLDDELYRLGHTKVFIPIKYSAPLRNPLPPANDPSLHQCSFWMPLLPGFESLLFQHQRFPL